tara:strand:- start:884 stop:1072 length:189 start_codon:yes stop_codon:yes gene_type:complete
MSKKEKKKKKNHENISDSDLVNKGVKKVKKRNTKNNRHRTNQFTREYGDDIEFSENFEKFDN